MSKISNANSTIVGTNENGSFSMNVDECFRLPSGRVVMTGKVTEGRIWPNNGLTININGASTTLNDNVEAIEKNKRRLVVANVGDEIAISLTKSRFHDIAKHFPASSN